MITATNKKIAKTIFDDKFSYLKVPIEVLKTETVNEQVKTCNPNLMANDIPRLRCAEGPDFTQFTDSLNSDEKLILSRIVFWTRKGMPCTHSNAQFAELIGKSEKTARNIIYKLIRHKLIDPCYGNDKAKGRKGAYRDLTALVSIKPELVLKRKAQQSAKKMAAGCHPTWQLSTQKGAKAGNGRPGTTKYTTKKQLRPSSPSPADGQAQTANNGELCFRCDTPATRTTMHTGKKYWWCSRLCETKAIRERLIK